MINKIYDMMPDEIRIAMIRARITQAELARRNKVKPITINRIISGTTVSDRVMRSIAEAIGIDVKRIWPSIYLFGGPRKPGRPKKDSSVMPGLR